MSYRNPEIITDRSGEILAQGIASFGQSIGAGIMKAGENAERRRKETEAKNAKMQQMMTEGQLAALKRSTDFNSKLPKTTLTENIKPIVRERLMYGADLKIELFSETDPERRQELLQEIAGVDQFLSTTAAGLGKLSEDVGAFSDLSPSEMNAQYGIVGDAAGQINNTGVLMGLAGQADEANFTPYYDPKTNSIVVNGSGRTGDTPFSAQDFNFASYTTGSDLIFPIDQMRKEAADSASKLIINKDGKVQPGLLNTAKLEIVDQDIIKDGKKIGSRKVQGQIETINNKAVTNTINPLVDAEVKSFLTVSDQQKESILETQYDADWSEISKLSIPNQEIALKELMEPKIIEDVFGNDFKKGNIGGEKDVYYRATETLKAVSTGKSDGKGSGKKVDIKIAEDFTDDILKANSKKNKSFFLNKEYKGKTIQEIEWNGDSLTIFSVDKDNNLKEEGSVNMKRRGEVESFVNDLIREEYGSDATSEAYREASKQYLRKRQADYRSEIDSTSYRKNQ